MHSSTEGELCQQLRFAFLLFGIPIILIMQSGVFSFIWIGVALWAMFDWSTKDLSRARRTQLESQLADLNSQVNSLRKKKEGLQYETYAIERQIKENK